MVGAHPTRTVEAAATPSDGTFGKEAPVRIIHPAPLSDRQLRQAGADAGIDVTDRDDLLSAAATGLADLLWDTTAYRTLCAGRAPVARARAILERAASDDAAAPDGTAEADALAHWWLAEHRQATDASTLQLEQVADDGELERLTRILSRSRDGYGLPPDVVWRIHAATCEQLWDLLETTLPAEVTHPGAHLGSSLKRLVLDEVVELLSSPERLVTCGAAHLRTGELFDTDTHRHHLELLRVWADHLETVATTTLSPRRTLWLLAAQAATTCALRPPLPLWRRSLADLASLARAGALDDREAGSERRYTPTSPRPTWRWDAPTLSAAQRRPATLSAAHVHRLTRSTLMADAAADQQALRRDRLGATGTAACTTPPSSLWQAHAPTAG